MSLESTDRELLEGRGASVLDRLVAGALRNRLLVVIGLLMLIGAGLHAMTRLPIDAVPDVTNVQVQVLTDAPALGPLEIERFVTTPVEQSMGGLPHLEEMRSISRYGLSAVTIVFEEGTDIWWARQVVGERLVEAKGEIPEGYGEPEMGPVTSGLGEIFQFEVRGLKGQSLMDLRDVLDWQIAPRLRTVDGVVEVNSFGGELRTYEVRVTPEALASHALALADVFDALDRNNVNVGGGSIEKGREQVLVRGVSLLDTRERIAAVVVATTPEGTPITIGNLGTVEFAPMLRQGAVTRDGRGEIVSGIAMMRLGGNSRVVAGSLQEAVDELQKTLPDVQIEVFYNRTELVDRTIETVAENLAEGALLVAFVLLLTLGNWRAALIAAAIIPLSLLFALIGMNLLGVSGNLMSLGAIDFGLMVDGAVVLLENVLHTVHVKRQRGEEVDSASILGAVRQVARPVAFAVGIIILVYLPILSFSGIEGKMFRPMAITVVLALTGSLLLTLTLVPVLASTFLVGAKDGDTLLMRVLDRVYAPTSGIARRLSPVPTILAVCLFLCSGLAAPFLGAEFVPTLEEGSLALQIIRPPSVSLSESIQQATDVERTLRSRFPSEIETVVCKTGRAEIATDPMGVDLSDVIVQLKPMDEWKEAADKEELIEKINEALLSAVPGVNFSYGQPIQLRVNELIEGVRSDVAIVIYGDDLEKLRSAGDAIATAVARVEGATDVKAEQVAGLPMLRVEVDPTRIARLGMSARDVLDGVEAIGGVQVGTVVQGQRRFALQVRFPEEIRKDRSRLEGILVGRAGGAPVPLKQVATITDEEGPLQISHDDGRRRLTVEVNVRGRDVAGFVADAQRTIDAEVTLPPGYQIEWGGSFQNLADASARLAVLVPVVLLLIFVLLQAMFGSTKMSLMVYANVPLAATGGIFALLLRGLPFSISAGVGFITLFGIAVLNGIVLVSHMRRLQEEGRTSDEAAAEGARDRLRTVVMTTMVAAFGFLPMALARSAGAEVQRPLATVVIGGLVTSTLLTLYVLPALFGWAMRGDGPPPRPVEPPAPPPEPVVPAGAPA
ncbi:MAG: CusA/CzcA family heavy metal efflux RND transporter [Myxococcota bacterium]